MSTIQFATLGTWLQAWLPIILNALTLGVIVIAAYIYKKQWETMHQQVGMAKRQLDAMVATEQAYVGITNQAIGTEMHTGDLNLLIGKTPTLHVTWFNGGKTPAMHFRTIPYLVFGEKPERRGYLIDDDWSDIRGSFLPAGEARTMPYPQAETGFKPLTQEMVEELRNGKKSLYAIITALYMDFTGQYQEFETSAIYNVWDGTFTELHEYGNRDERKPRQNGL